MKVSSQRTLFFLSLLLALAWTVPGAARAGSALHRIVREGDCIRSLLLDSNCVTAMADYVALRAAFARQNPGLFHSALLTPGSAVTVPVLSEGRDQGCLTFREQRVVRIDYEGEASRERVFVYLDGPVLPDVFTLEKTQPVRVVCDFDGTLPEADLPRDVDTGGRMIRKIRVGHEDKPFRRARIVLDVDGRIEQEFFEQKSLFVLTVHEIGAD
jgi:hypothetical protein